MALLIRCVVLIMIGLSVCRTEDFRCPQTDVDFQRVHRDGRTCYAFSARLLSRDDAGELCRQRGGSLLETRTVDQLDMAVTYMKSVSLTHLWIGGRRVDVPWQWTDGSHLGSFTPWTNALSSTPMPWERCAAIMTTSGAAEWVTSACARPLQFICQLAADHENCSSSSARDHTMANGSCFVTSRAHGIRSWFNAREDCRRMGGELATVDTKTRQAACKRLFVERDAYWIGLRRSKWIWQNGEEIDSYFWERGQPSGDGHCVALRQFGRHTYLWDARNCNTSHAFACQIDIARKKIPTETTSTKTSLTPDYRRRQSEPEIATDGTNKKALNGLMIGGLVVLVTFLVCTLAALVLFFSCYGRESRREARTMAPHRREESHVTSGDVRPDIRKTAALFNVQIDIPSPATTKLHRENGIVRAHDKIPPDKIPRDLQRGVTRTSGKRNTEVNKTNRNRESSRYKSKYISEKEDIGSRGELPTKKLGAAEDFNLTSIPTRDDRQIDSRVILDSNLLRRDVCASRRKQGDVTGKTGKFDHYDRTDDDEKTYEAEKGLHDDGGSGMNTDESQGSTFALNHHDSQDGQAQLASMSMRDKSVTGKPPTRKRRSNGDTSENEFANRRAVNDDALLTGTLLRTDDDLKRIIDSYAKKTKRYIEDL